MENQLAKIIRDKIKEKGPISFHDYMEMALYYPSLGYYTSPADKIGTEGDYFTAPYFTNVYGCIIARQIEEMWDLLGKEKFTIVEYGAGPGSLCNDILSHLKNNPELFKHLSFCIIEKSAAMREKEIAAINIKMLDKVQWYNSTEDLSPFNGCVIANEVLDNFSVHKVVKSGAELKEIYVDHKDQFVETMLPASTELKDYFMQLNVDLPEDFCTEANLEAIDWLKKISTSLQSGFIITIDYGFPSSELYRTYRSKGTMICYHKHAVNDNYYDNIGEQDITSHVNFSALDLWGKKNGLTSCGFTTQSQFLLSLGLTEHLRQVEEQNTDISTRQRLLLVYNLLMSMGKKFKVFIQQKGLKQSSLSGLKFCQPLA